MPRKRTVEDIHRQIEQLRRQEAELRAREREEAARADAARKTFAGTVALEHADQSEAFREQLYRALDRRLKRPVDRALFDLPALERAPEAERPPSEPAVEAPSPQPEPREQPPEPEAETERRRPW